LVNLAWYESLPSDLQQAFDEAAQEAIALSDKLNREMEAEFIRKLADKLEVNYVTGSDLEPFREAVQPVYQYYIDKGDLTWEEVKQARKAARGE
jgi:C4-dicarboxylate-binding protein DctP